MMKVLEYQQPLVNVFIPFMLISGSIGRPETLLKNPCIKTGINGTDVDFIHGLSWPCCLVNNGYRLVNECKEGYPASTVISRCPDGTYMDEDGHANRMCKEDKICGPNEVRIDGGKIAPSRCKCKSESPLHPGECINNASNEVTTTSIPPTETASSNHRRESSSTFKTALSKVVNHSKPVCTDSCIPLTVIVVFIAVFIAGTLLLYLYLHRKKENSEEQKSALNDEQIMPLRESDTASGNNSNSQTVADMEKVIQYFYDKSRDGNFALRHDDVSKYLNLNGVVQQNWNESVLPPARMADEIKENYQSLGWTAETVIRFFEDENMRLIVEELQRILHQNPRVEVDETLRFQSTSCDGPI